MVSSNEDDVQVRSIMWYKNATILENRIDIYIVTVPKTIHLRIG